MNDYMKLIAHAAMKFTGKPAVLSPLLDSYCGWENKKNRFSSEPIQNDVRLIFSVSGLSTDELEVEFDECLKVCMKHGSKILGENNFNWTRDCTYKYAIESEVVPFLSVYWTSDDFLVIQAREIENSLAEKSTVKDLQKYKLLPIDLIDVLEPALNVPFLKQIMKAVQKKSSDIVAYINSAAELPEASDFLSLLSCVPLSDKKDLDLQKLLQSVEDTAQSSQDESATEKSQTDSEDISPTKKSSSSAKRETRQTRGKSKSK